MVAKKVDHGVTPPLPGRSALSTLKAGLRRWILGFQDRPGRNQPGREQPAEFYDARFASSTGLQVHYTRSPYYPLWTVVTDRLVGMGARQIIDIGCGPGQFACLLRDHGIPQYLGLDFSRQRIEYARKSCPEFRFEIVDLFASDLLRTSEYDAVVALEFLEHVQGDLEVLRQVRPGCNFIGTVPNYHSAGHVRIFQSAAEVDARYRSELDELRVDPWATDPHGKTIFLLQGRRRGAPDE
jgi:SAM-dependent methyltransferase